jgi:hypothetical protein
MDHSGSLGVRVVGGACQPFTCWCTQNTAHTCMATVDELVQVGTGNIHGWMVVMVYAKPPGQGRELEAAKRKRRGGAEANHSIHTWAPT